MTRKFVFEMHETHAYRFAACTVSECNGHRVSGLSTGDGVDGGRLWLHISALRFT